MIKPQAEMRVLRANLRWGQTYPKAKPAGALIAASGESGGGLPSSDLRWMVNFWRESHSLEVFVFVLPG